MKAFCKILLLKPVLIILFMLHADFAMGQQIRNERDKQVISDSISVFLNQFKNALCLCDDLMEGKVSEQSTAFKNFNGFFIANDTAALTTIFFDSSLVQRDLITPTEFLDLTKAIYEGITGLETDLLFLRDFRAESSGYKNLRSISNFINMKSIKDNLYEATIYAKLSTFEGQYPLEKNSFNVLGNNITFTPEKNFSQKNIILAFNVQFEIEKSTFLFPSIFRPWSVQRRIKPGSLRLAGVNEMGVSALKEHDSGSLADDNWCSRLDFTEDVCDMIVTETQNKLRSFYPLFEMRDNMNKVDTAADFNALKSLFDNPKMLNISTRLFFEESDEDFLTIDEFIKKFQETYSKNETFPDFEAEESEIIDVQTVGRKSLRIHAMSNTVRINLQVKNDSIGSDFQRDSTQLNISLVTNYRTRKDIGSGEKRLIINPEDIKIYMISDNFDDLPIKVDKPDYYSVGVTTQLNFAQIRPTKESFFNNYRAIPQLSFATGIDFTYFPIQKEGVFDFGIGAGLYYQSTALELAMDSLADEFLNENGLGEYLHHVYGSDIGQKANVSALSIPITGNLRYQIGADSYLTFGIGALISWQQSVKYSGIKGNFTHTGLYDFTFPDGSITQMMLQNLPYYHFSDYSATFTNNVETIHDWTFSGLIKANFSRLIAKDKPLYLNAGFQIMIGLSDAFSDKESGSYNRIISSQGDIGNLFTNETNRKISSAGLSIGLTYYLKEKQPSFLPND
jgi:hypothetical protein